MNPFQDFDLTIAANGRNKYALALRSPAGEAHVEVSFTVPKAPRLPPAPSSTKAGASHRKNTGAWFDAPVEKLQALGQRLFETFFSAEVRRLYTASRAMTQQQGQGLRLRLCLREAPLRRLPWEVLYDPSAGGAHLGLSIHSPVVRYVEAPRPPAAPSVQLPLRILGFASSPANLPHLNIAAEIQRLEEALNPAIQAKAIELHWVDGQTGSDLQQALQHGPWHIFHYIGHGAFNQQPNLLLADPLGYAKPAPIKVLAPLFTDQRSLRLAVLNTCQGAVFGPGAFSSAAALLVGQGVPAVIAMQHGFSDSAAIEFAQSFYQALAAGWSLEASLAAARQALALADPASLEWAVPTLHLHTPDDALFALPTAQSAAPTKTLADWLSAAAQVTCSGQVSGIGFCVRPGLLLTTHFAVKDGGPLHVLAAGKTIPAELITACYPDNLALLKVPGLASPSLPLEDEPPAALDSTVHLIGRDPRHGIISVPGRLTLPAHLIEDPRLLAADVQIPRKFGGAPVFDAQGRLLGMVTFMWEVEGQVSQVYILPTCYLRQFVINHGP